MRPSRLKSLIKSFFRIGTCLFAIKLQLENQEAFF